MRPNPFRTLKEIFGRMAAGRLSRSRLGMENSRAIFFSAGTRDAAQKAQAAQGARQGVNQSPCSGGASRFAEASFTKRRCDRVGFGPAVLHPIRRWRAFENNPARTDGSR